MVKGSISGKTSGLALMVWPSNTGMPMCWLMSKSLVLLMPKLMLKWYEIVQIAKTIQFTQKLILWYGNLLPMGFIM
jgi:hypothetical protein